MTDINSFFMFEVSIELEKSKNSIVKKGIFYLNIKVIKRFIQTLKKQLH